MPRYVAFLRAINVGGHNVKMEHLRALFEQMGFAHVETFIASGNVIFESPIEDPTALEAQIEQQLKAALGYEVKTFARSPAELAAIVAYRPFPAGDLEAEGNSLYVALLSAPPDAEAQGRLLALQTPTDAFHFQGRDLYWLLRTKLSESSLFSGAVLEKTLRTSMTMRNITTIRRLAARYAGEP